MFAAQLEQRFARIGARARVHPAEPRRRLAAGVRVDVGRDREGEFFDIAFAPADPPELTVLDVRPELRHLVLLARDDAGKHKFLCGHDERHWFVAAVPERRGASTVRTAFEALKPREVLDREIAAGVKPRRRNRRRNEAFIRQGEWFFVPADGWRPASPNLILRNEPLRRGGGKPHVCEELVREGGQTVYVCRLYPNGLPEAQYRRLLEREPRLRTEPWRAMRRNPQVYVRGKVRHADHQTIVLPEWRRVLVNTEHESAARAQVAFLD